MRTSHGFGLKQAGFNHEETLNLLKRSSSADLKQKPRHHSRVFLNKVNSVFSMI